MRPSRDEYYMLMAEFASFRSTCLSRKVGAVIVSDDALIATGYNGPARTVEHCEEKGGCQRRAMPDYASGKYLEMCPAVHAEANSIAMAARRGISTVGATIYVNTFPCKDCMNLIINAGIKKVIYNSSYNSELSWKIAQMADIELEQYSGRPFGEILMENENFANSLNGYKQRVRKIDM